MKKKVLMLVPMAIVTVVFFLLRVFAAEGIQQIIYEDSSSVVVNQTSYSFATNLGYGLLKMHMMIGLGMNMSGNITDMNYLELIHELRNNSSYNVMELLEFELDRAKVMDSYLHLLDVSLLKANLALSNISEDLVSLEGDVDYCVSSKKQSDIAYVDSINALYQSQMMNKSLQDSMKYGQCISDKNIQYSAKKLLSDKISFYRNIVKVKYDYLSKNNDMIVNHYDLIKGNLLQTLLSIKNMLEKYDF